MGKDSATPASGDTSCAGPTASAHPVPVAGAPPRTWLRRRGPLLLYPFFLAVTVAIAVEVGARAWFDDLDDTAALRQRAFEHLLNSAVTGGEAGPLGVRLTPNQEHVVHWTHLSYTVRSNRLGFRGPAPEPRRPGELRLLFLGDSMIFGHGLQEDETIPTRVEALSDSLPRPVTACNGALNGMNTVQELLAGRQLLPLVQPDRVLLGYFVGNDPLPDTFARIGSDGTYDVDTLRIAALRTELDTHLSPWMSSVACRAALPLYIPQVRYRWSRRDAVLQRSADLVARLRDLCARYDAPLSVLVIYPRDGVEGGPAAWWSGSRRTGRRLMTRFAALGIEVLDTTELMSGTADRDRYYFPVDGHLNPAGASRIARAVVERWVRPAMEEPVTDPSG